MSALNLNPEYIRDRLEYCPETGRLFWKSVPEANRTSKSWNTKYAGKEAGTIRQVGENGLAYRFISLDGNICRAHHIVWLFEHGTITLGIDHKDGNGLNNHISNLRELDHPANIRKGKLQTNNTSGYKGVSVRADGQPEPRPMVFINH